METEVRNQNQRGCKPLEPEVFLQWGKRKRLRCPRNKDPEISERLCGRLRKKIGSRSDRCVISSSDKERIPLQPNRLTRLEIDAQFLLCSTLFLIPRLTEKRTIMNEISWSITSICVVISYVFVLCCVLAFSSPPPARKESNSREDVSPEITKGTSPSPEKEDRYYATRGSAAAVVDENGHSQGHEERGGSFVLPKLLIALSSKEKEEDFMAMKGCKLPQRPKKRAKMIQRSLLLVSPGAWLTEMSQERYEVREKKTTKKRPTGLKAMGSMETDSE